MDHPTRRLNPTDPPDPAVEHPTRRLDRTDAPGLPADHPTRRMDPTEARDQEATTRLDAAPQDPARCPQCQGPMLWGRPVGRDTYRVFRGDLALDNPRHGLARRRLEARTCMTCGYTEFFAPLVPHVTLIPGPTPAPPAERGPCAVCRDLVACQVVGGSLDPSAAHPVFLNQQSGGWPSLHQTRLEAQTCSHCGRAYLYGADPTKLLGEYIPLAPPRPCVRCAQPVIPVRGLSYGRVTVFMQKHIPVAWRGPKFSPLIALTCPACGYTALYATDLATLQES
jgi:predicted nucleic-acid-binding Zn-ribbon protein